MAKYLVIVESPTKAKTLSRFLGRDFIVKASKGHIKDLPKSRLGVDIENDFKPHFTTIKGKSTILKELKEAAQKVEAVFLATDPDREGEAISWHLEQELKKVNPNIYRITFHEITRKAVEEAISNPGQVDLNKVKAQFARRILDRLVGYFLSPLLWRKVDKGLSAGRVQSVALRLIAEREKEIKEFVPKDFWKVWAEVKIGNNSSRFDVINYTSQKSPFFEESIAKKALDYLKKNRELKVLTIKKRKTTRKSPPPFTTSKLQQEAATKLGFSPKKTMMIAQQLYEGIDVGSGPVGLITYMRTDSVRMADEAVKSIRNFIQSNFGKDFLPEAPKKYRNRDTSQDAHEAIRPTDITRTPQSIANYLSRDQLRLYELIWKRTIASQMKDAVMENTSIDVGDDNILLRARGQRILFPGFLKIYGTGDKEEILPFPEIKEGSPAHVVEATMTKHQTQPPPRYTEASLVKTLEEKGIGRPSTYATIVSTIQERRYVEKREGKFFLTELGEKVNEILVENFPDYINVEFTASMESNLDKIENQGEDHIKLLRDFFPKFKTTLEEAEKNIQSQKIIKEETDIKCPICGSPMVLRRWKGRYALSCSRKGCGGFLLADYSEETGEIKPLLSSIKCPKCGAPLAVRYGRYGRFLSCSRYPECDYLQPYVVEGVKCPKCGGYIYELRSKKGKTYYKCENGDWISFYYVVPQASCPVCGYPLVKKGKKLVCSNPECNFVASNG